MDKENLISSKYDKFWENKKWSDRLNEGHFQFDTLIEFGLQPYHYLLDIGCGYLRGGIHFIRYLDEEHYYAFDKFEKWLHLGELLLKYHNLEYKKPIINHVYDLRRIKRFLSGKQFDYMMAYSIFTHTDPYMTERILASTLPYLKSEGKFFATCLLSDDIYVGRFHKSRSHEYSVVKYTLEFFEGLAYKYHINLKYLDSVEDNRRQDWILFTKNR